MMSYKMDDFDFVRLTLVDINGCHLTKLVSTKHKKRIEKNQINMYGGFIAIGIRMEFVHFDEFVDNKTKNAYLYPDMASLVPIKWAYDNEKNYKVGELICDLKWDDNDPLLSQPRTVAKQQLDKLASLGFELYSAFEPEFRVFKKNTYEPYTKDMDSSKTSLHQIYEHFFMDATTLLDKANIDIQDCVVEHGEGQLEMPLMPSYGLKAGDDIVRFKQGIREIANLHGMTASFMTQPLPKDESASSAFHFNHSIRSLSNKSIVMYDEKDPLKLSTITRHWLGGLMKHLGAMTALFCPTTNCYSRLHKFLTPTYIDWDVNCRHSSIRVKNDSPESTYIENRVPSSAANPYIVLAATVAAGMDGLINKIEPPVAGSKTNGTFPKTFQEALDALEADTVLTEALGGGDKGLVKYFCKIKRNVDLEEVPNKNDAYGTESGLLRLEAERRLYFDYV